MLLDSSSGNTRILVTHALHFLPKVDHIYFLVDGRITEHGTFDEMMVNGGDFARTFDEFVTKYQTESKGEKAGDVEDADADENAKKRRAAPRGAQLMQAEERNTGAVNAQVYKQYIQSGNGIVLMPVMFATIVLMQVSIVLSSYWWVILMALILKDADEHEHPQAGVVARTVGIFEALVHPWLMDTIANGNDLKDFMYVPGYCPN